MKRILLLDTLLQLASSTIMFSGEPYVKLCHIWINKHGLVCVMTQSYHSRWMWLKCSFFNDMLEGIGILQNIDDWQFVSKQHLKQKITKLCTISDLFNLYIVMHVSADQTNGMFVCFSLPPSIPSSPKTVLLLKGEQWGGSCTSYHPAGG